jgi:hypothetical protein
VCIMKYHAINTGARVEMHTSLSKTFQTHMGSTQRGNDKNVALVPRDKTSNVDVVACKTRMDRVKGGCRIGRTRLQSTRCTCIIM